MADRGTRRQHECHGQHLCRAQPLPRRLHRLAVLAPSRRHRAGRQRGSAVTSDGRVEIEGARGADRPRHDAQRRGSPDATSIRSPSRSRRNVRAVHLTFVAAPAHRRHGRDGVRRRGARVAGGELRGRGRVRERSHERVRAAGSAVAPRRAAAQPVGRRDDQASISWLRRWRCQPWCRTARRWPSPGGRTGGSRRPR